MANALIEIDSRCDDIHMLGQVIGDLIAVARNVVLAVLAVSIDVALGLEKTFNLAQSLRILTCYVLAIVLRGRGLSLRSPTAV